MRPTPMFLRTLALVLAVLVLAACGSRPEPSAADEPGEPDTTVRADAMPSAIPPAAGPVRTRHLVTVMDTGSPELCLGPVAESYPPQCGGPVITNWDWQKQGRGMFDKAGNVRWGMYAVTGTFDGSRFTVTDAIPAALYSPAAPVEETEAPGPGGFDEEELNQRLRGLPGLLSSYAENGRLLVEVVHDDGTLQEWADAELGAGVVRISSALVPLE